jgi:starch synthase (maltosyl-transferring)
MKHEAEEPRRVVIESVKPEIDGGRFAVKRVAGDSVHVEADIFADGHDELAARLLYRKLQAEGWQETALNLLYNDHWLGDFPVEEVGVYAYAIEAWVDRFATWRRDLRKRVDAGQDVDVELMLGAAMLRAAAKNAPRSDSARLLQRAEGLSKSDWPQATRADIAFEETSLELMQRYGDRGPVTRYDHGQRVTVDRERAGFSAWYELFPRSTSPVPGEHGSFRTTIDRLPYVAGMGFDVLYLPPIHPIGETNRKGKNNAERGRPGEPGSPWAIGGKAGGHTAIHPELGTVADFKALISAARELGMEIALDLAYQCTPDHPWVEEHPQWFRHRPDGTIRFAENPPKLYQDIYPIDFETEDREALWQALEEVVRYWIDKGVHIFRVDNPHTKAFAFWEHMICRVRADHPQVLFLAEAFTRPRTMEYLAKLGFSQSYTYFTWRNTKWELTSYLQELTQTPVHEYFRPNFWPNTPDILHESLQTGGRPAFVSRFLLAATLSSNYGIYGPAFELGVNVPREPGSEEYRDSEKYEVKHWDLEQPQSLRDLIARVNQARRENPALQRNDGLRFHNIENDQLIAYTKTSRDGANCVLALVNLDPHDGHTGTLWLPLAELGLPETQPFAVDDLLSGDTETWMGAGQLVDLHPRWTQVRLLRLRRGTA